mgnify:CR=1 FL=1
MSDENRNRQLLDGYCSESLTSEEFSEFEEALRQDASLRHLLIEYRILDSDLRDYASADVRDSPAHEASVTNLKTIRRMRVEVWAMAAVIVVLLIGVAVSGVRGYRDGLVVEAEPALDPGVAVLTQSVNASWKNREVRSGDAMEPGLWTLLEGTAEFEFYSGASVILEAPAELEILSENGGILRGGKLRADVPHHAHGFTITTDTVELVDLGTSFGMEVGEGAETAVHVFDGKVELFEPNSDRIMGQGKELLAGEGRLVGSTGETSSFAADDSRFISPTQLEKGTRDRIREKYLRWQQAAEDLRKDSKLVAYYDFEGASDRSLLNRSADSSDGLRGAVIGAQWSSGRWPDKGALDFKRPSDRVRVEVPGKFESMTLVTWVRVDGFDNQFHSLLLSDGWGRPGALHWQIHRDGFVELAVWNGQIKTHNSRAPFLMAPADFGRWTQLAVAYDGGSGSVTHYRDGSLLGQIDLSVTVPLAIGKAEIGNWTPPQDDSRQVRQFNGRMDEMMIFNEALSAVKIQELYQHGNP